MAVVEIDGLVVGGRALHRQVQAHGRIVLRDPGHEGRVGADQGIDPGVGCARCRGAPTRPIVGLGIRIERHQHFATAVVGVSDALGDGMVVKVQAGEVARIGGVAKAEVYAISAIVDCGPEGGQAAGRAYEFWHDGCGWRNARHAATGV